MHFALHRDLQKGSPLLFSFEKGKQWTCGGDPPACEANGSAWGTATPHQVSPRPVFITHVTTDPGDFALRQSFQSIANDGGTRANNRTCLRTLGMYQAARTGPPDTPPVMTQYSPRGFPVWLANYQGVSSTLMAHLRVRITIHQIAINPTQPQQQRRPVYPVAVRVIQKDPRAVEKGTAERRPRDYCHASHALPRPQFPLEVIVVVTPYLTHRFGCSPTEASGHLRYISRLKTRLGTRPNTKRAEKSTSRLRKRPTVHGGQTNWDGVTRPNPDQNSASCPVYPGSVLHKEAARDMPNLVICLAGAVDHFSPRRNGPRIGSLKPPRRGRRSRVLCPIRPSAAT